MSLTTQYERLQQRIADILGDSVSNVTTDGQYVSPSPGKPSVLVEPPDIESDRWKSLTPTWRIDVIAGSSTTQALSVFDCFAALDKLAEGNLNIASATPITFRSNGLTLAGYQITLNPLD